MLVMVVFFIALDRKSGSAGMPRPISYAVFCLKKKKMNITMLLIFLFYRHVFQRDLHSFPTRRSSDLLAIIQTFFLISWFSLLLLQLLRHLFYRHLKLHRQRYILIVCRLMLVMVVFFIAFRWIHLSTPLIWLFLLVLILLLLPTLNFMPVWFAFCIIHYLLSSHNPMMFILWMVAMMVVIIPSRTV